MWNRRSGDFLNRAQIILSAMQNVETRQQFEAAKIVVTGGHTVRKRVLLFLILILLLYGCAHKAYDQNNPEEYVKYWTKNKLTINLFF